MASKGEKCLHKLASTYHKRNNGYTWGYVKKTFGKSVSDKLLWAELDEYMTDEGEWKDEETT